MADYYRPLVRTDPARPRGALPVAGGWGWFEQAERLRRDGPPEIVAAAAVPGELRDTLTAPRPPLAGLTPGQPGLMGILNVTPDSFSDGGRYRDQAAALAHARSMAAAGADIVDIGGESTRPGAKPVDEEEEIRRTAPVIRAIARICATPLSIDTRKSAVARAALDAGAAIINDVAALGHDPALATLAARRGVPVCLMHMQGTPGTMQDDPRYGDVVLDVYDFLAERIRAAEAAGLTRQQLIVDPGIGFGKTVAHNLALLRRLSLFHGLGCPILLGASRKRFIGTLGAAPEPDDRLAGSLAVALAAVQQGVQILRVHDIAATRQALTLHRAIFHHGQGARHG